MVGIPFLKRKKFIIKRRKIISPANPEVQPGVLTMFAVDGKIFAAYGDISSSTIAILPNPEKEYQSCVLTRSFLPKFFTKHVKNKDFYPISVLFRLHEMLEVAQETARRSNGRLSPWRDADLTREAYCDFMEEKGYALEATGFVFVGRKSGADNAPNGDVPKVTLLTLRQRRGWDRIQP